jgi:peptide/nickel transport system substrate-binding protein
MTGIEEIIRQMEGGDISRRSFGASAATPKKGGQIKAAFLMASAAEGLDPAKFKKPIDYTRGYQLYNNLVSIDSKLLPQPELAESWEPNADASEWVFKLRKGIKFHDGKAFTAKDVIYTMSRVKDPETGSPGKPYLDSVVEMKADGDHTLRIKLTEPSVDFPVIMAEYRLMVIPEGHTNFDKPNGTGAFKLKEFKAGMHMIAVRNSEYWKDGLPYVDQVETFSIPDPVARTSALMTIGHDHYGRRVQGPQRPSGSQISGGSGKAHQNRPPGFRHSGQRSSHFPG